MSLENDGRDVGELLSYALRPRMRPGGEGDYGRLLRRYQDEMSFRSAFDDVADGLGLQVLHAGDLGVVLTARRESVFAYRLTNDPGTGSSTENALRGLAHIGIAAYVYPHPDDLLDPTIRYVNAVEVEAFIRRSCAELKARAERVAQGGEAADRAADLALAAGLDTVWSEWDQMSPGDLSSRGRGAGRPSKKSAIHWVLRACKDLVEHGLARPVGKELDAQFQLLERFRHHVARDASLEGYQALAVLARVDDLRTDPHDDSVQATLLGRPPRWLEAEFDARKPETGHSATSGSKEEL